MLEVFGRLGYVHYYSLMFTLASQVCAVLGWRVVLQSRSPEVARSWRCSWVEHSSTLESPVDIMDIFDGNWHAHTHTHTHSTERTQNYPKTTVFVVRTKSCFPCVRLRVRTSLVVQARRFSALRSCHHGFRVRCIDSAFVSICQCRALVSAFALGFYTFLLMLKRAAICCRFVSGRRELQPS